MLQMLNKIRIILSAKYKWGAIALIFGMGVCAVLELCGLALIIPVISAVADSSLLEKNRWLNLLYRLSGASDAGSFLIISASALILFYLLKNACCYVMVCIQSKYTMKLSASLANRMYRNYIRAPYTFHLKTGPSELLARLNQVYDFTMGFLLPLMLVLSEGMVFVAVVCLIFWVMPVVGLCALTMGGLAFLLFYLPLKKIIVKYGKLNYEASLELIKHLTQGLGAVREMKLSGSEVYFSELANQAQIRRNYAQKRVSDIGQVPRFALECFSVAAAMGILVTLLMMNVPFSQILITASFFVAAMSRLMPSFSRIQYNLLHVRAAGFLFDKIFQDLTSVPQEEPASGAPLTFREQITVDNVTFSYSPETKPVLENLSLTVRKNECVAFVGRTGCGKSTLSDIIMGFLKPQKGSVKADGRDICENPASWREKIGYVPQNIHIFDDTIRSNVAFGIPKEQISEERVRNALSLAQLSDFVESLPQRLDTPAGEGGARLSGGQKQRIAIARALYRNPEILVLDEATSALDQETEHDFIVALQNLKGKFTILMIAHRLSSIQYCDRTISLDRPHA